jgi:hypothetical protein
VWTVSAAVQAAPLPVEMEEHPRVLDPEGCPTLRARETTNADGRVRISRAGVLGASQVR